MVNKGRFFVILRFVISFGLLLTLLWIMRHNIGDIINILKNSNKKFFLLGLLVSVPLPFLISYRLKQFMLGQKIILSMKDFVYLTFIGYFFNNFFPTAIGGDIAKAYYASKKTNSNTASYAAILTDRLCGFAAIMMIALIGLAFIGSTLNNYKIVLAILGMSVILILLIFLLSRGKVTLKANGIRSRVLDIFVQKLMKIYNAINIYRHHHAILTKAILISLIAQLGSILSIYLFIYSLGGNIGFLKLFLVIPLIWAVSMLPSLNGLGVREGAFVYFLKGDIGTDIAFALSILWLGMIILYSIVGGVMHLIYPFKKTNAGGEQ